MKTIFAADYSKMSLRCRIGWHSWRRYVNAIAGKHYHVKECSRCDVVRVGARVVSRGSRYN